MTVIPGVDYLSAPAAAVIPLATIKSEPTPIYTAAVREHAAEQLARFAQQPPAAAGETITCPACGRSIKARRDGFPVRHKAGGVWCVPIPRQR